MTTTPLLPTEPKPETGTEPQTRDNLPILLTEGEPIGESVFAHSTLEDPQHPATHRNPDDVAPPT